MKIHHLVALNHFMEHPVVLCTFHQLLMSFYQLLVVHQAVHKKAFICLADHLVTAELLEVRKNLWEHPEGHQHSAAPLEALTNVLRSTVRLVALNTEQMLLLGLGHQEVQKLEAHR